MIAGRYQLRAHIHGTAALYKFTGLCFKIFPSCKYWASKVFSFRYIHMVCIVYILDCVCQSHIVANTFYEPILYNSYCSPCRINKEFSVYSSKRNTGNKSFLRILLNIVFRTSHLGNRAPSRPQFQHSKEESLVA